jgi:YVTN family beta-propeller protein
VDFSFARRQLIFLVLTALAVSAAASQGTGYHLLKEIRYGAAPGGKEYYDYLTLDAATRRLYLSHGTEIKVVNADTGAEAGTIPDMKLNHGIALVSEFGKGFATDGGNDTVVVFDLRTLAVISKVQAVAEPDCIIYEPSSKRVFVFNGHGHAMTVINPANLNVLATVPMGGTPESAVADGRGTIYDNNFDTNEVLAINSHTLAVKTRWPVAPAGSPTAMAMDREHRRLFVAGRDPQFLVVINADSGRVIQSFPISSGVDSAVFDPDTGLLFASTRDGLIHVFHEDSPDSFSVLEPVKTQYGAKTMALDPKTHNLYLTTSDFGAPPPPTPEQPHPQPNPMDRTPGTFRLLIYAR